MTRTGKEQPADARLWYVEGAASPRFILRPERVGGTGARNRKKRLGITARDIREAWPASKPKPVRSLAVLPALLDADILARLRAPLKTQEMRLLENPGLRSVGFGSPRVAVDAGWLGFLDSLRDGR